MDSPTRTRYETQSKDLRQKIKSWEVDFYNSHDGSKPSRNDIKECDMCMNTRVFKPYKYLSCALSLTLPPPAATYTEYQRLRDILSGKLPPPKAPKNNTDETHHRKRKSPEQQHGPSHTPSTKRFKAVETPSSRGQNHGESIAMNMFTPGSGAAMTPSLSRKLFHSSPAIPTSIGPTPQRDGRVLGLFDLLPFKDTAIDSPSKPNGAVRLSQVIEAGRQVMAAQQTPRTASRLLEVQPGGGPAAALGRTPSSRHKRHGGLSSPGKRLLSTPLKSDGNASRVAKTPGGTSGSVSRLQFQTPAFLRRIQLPKAGAGTAEFASPELKMRLPRKPLLRGLSSVVADLRRMQEAELDDDLDALREAEMEMEGGGSPSKPVNRTILSEKTNLPPNATTSQTPAVKQHNASILEEDSEKQALRLLGGFDDEGEGDSEGEQNAGMDRNGNPLRVFKKKGQKRTTRKSNMKPVMKRRATTATTNVENEDENPEPTTSTRRTRQAKTTTAADHGKEQDADNNDGDDVPNSGSEFTASDDEDELAQDPATAKGKSKAGRPAKKAASTKTAAAPAAKTKAPRKVNELAHANFKRLKLRQGGAKGGAAHNSRFRRRR